MDNSTTIDQTPAAMTREKISNDLRTLMHDAEDLWRITKDDLGERTKETRARLRDTLDKAKATAVQFEEKAVAGAKATDKIIRDHPYSSIGVAFGVGLLIGVLAGRR